MHRKLQLEGQLGRGGLDDFQKMGQNEGLEALPEDAKGHAGKAGQRQCPHLRFVADFRDSNGDGQTVTLLHIGQTSVKVEF